MEVLQQYVVNRDIINVEEVVTTVVVARLSPHETE